MPGMKGFRYVYSTKQITKVLEKIRTTGRPDKLTFSYMRDTWLIKNKQYGEMLTILRDMEFLDSSRVPTKLYAEYQNPKLAKKAIAKGARNAYPDLFKAYPNAQSLPKADLDGYFRQQTGKAGSVLEKISSTFRTLCSEGDFAEKVEVPEEVVRHEVELPAREERRVRIEPVIQVNVEIHIAADTPDDKIETIFKNMKKYLLTNE